MVVLLSDGIWTELADSYPSLTTEIKTIAEPVQACKLAGTGNVMSGMKMYINKALNLINLNSMTCDP